MLLTPPRAAVRQVLLIGQGRGVARVCIVPTLRRLRRRSSLVHTTQRPGMTRQGSLSLSPWVCVCVCALVMINTRGLKRDDSWKREIDRLGE